MVGDLVKGIQKMSEKLRTIGIRTIGQTRFQQPIRFNQGSTTKASDSTTKAP